MVRRHHLAQRGSTETGVWDAGSLAVDQTTVRHIEGGPTFRNLETHSFVSLINTVVFTANHYILSNDMFSLINVIEVDKSFFFL